MNTGEKLTEKQRNQLKSAIQTIVTASENNLNDFVNQTTQEFNERWLDPSVYIPKAAQEKAKKTTPQAGEGYTVGWKTYNLPK